MLFRSAITLSSRGAPFSDTALRRVRENAESWLREHLIDAHVAECRALSAGDVLFIRLEGTIGIRVDMLPILSKRDGTLVLISDPNLGARRVFR